MRMALSVLLTCCPPRAGGAVGVYLQVRRVDIYLNVADLGQHGHGGGARVYAPAGLRLGHALHTVDAALVLETRVGPRALDHEAYLLYPAELGLVYVGDGDLETVRLGVHCVHAVKAVGEERALLPADARAYLDYYVALVVRVFRHQQLAQPVREGSPAPFRILILLSRHLAQLRIREEPLGLGHVVAALEIFPRALSHRRELLQLPREAGIRRGVGVVLRQRHLALDFIVSRYYLLELFRHLHPPHSVDYCTTQCASDATTGGGRARSIWPFLFASRPKGAPPPTEAGIERRARRRHLRGRSKKLAIGRGLW